MNSLQIIKSLQATTSRTDKEQILISAFMDGERDFFTAAALALNPLVTFGVKKAAHIVEDDGDAGTFSFKDFLALAGKLQTRTLTGHAARDAINEAAISCHTETWNLFYRQVILKDLRCGVERSTFNKVIAYVAKIHPEANAFSIPVFGVQLAKDGADEANAKKIVGKKLIDMKLDGMRLATILNKQDGTVTQWTRTGHQNENFPHLCAALEKVLPELPCSMVLDAEVVSENFQKLMTQARRKTNPDTSDACLALFDIIPLSDFLNGKCDITQADRHDMLCELETSGLLQHVSGSSIYVMPKKEVDLDTEEGRAELRQFQAEAAQLGFEGVMVKDPFAGYVAKRSEAWFKIKPTITVDLTVTALEEGVGKNVGKLGAIVCEGVEDGKLIIVNVGSGFSDEDRVAIWANPALAVGQIVEIEADAITKSRDKDTYGLRFPTLKRFRSVNRVPGEKD